MVDLQHQSLKPSFSVTGKVGLKCDVYNANISAVVGKKFNKSETWEDYF